MKLYLVNTLLMVIILSGCKGLLTHRRIAAQRSRGRQMVAGRAGGGQMAAVEDLVELGDMGNDKNTCFHDESEVTTRRGPKHLRDVVVGEEVLTVSDSGILRYEPVIVDLHCDAQVHTWFYKLQTQMHEIMLTPNHQLYVGDTVESSQLMRAGDVTVGDSLIVKNNSTLGPEKVTHIELSYDQGISDPMVSSGRILINDILAAVYADDFAPLQAKHVHSMLWFNRILSSMNINLADVIEEKSGMPYWAAYGELLLKKFVSL